MTSFVAFPDLHTHVTLFKDMRHILAEVDAVLLAGDMTNGNASDLQRIISAIEPYNEQIYAVCGNMDTEAMNMALAREGIGIHRRAVLLDGIALCGVGGALPFAGRYVFSEAQFTQFLNDAVAGLPPNTPKILVCHQPPYGTLVDKLPIGHVGSHAVRAFIEAVQPLVCISGHIHEAVGIDRIGNTLLVNPGPLAQTRQYVYLEVEAGAVKTLEIRPVQALKLGKEDD